MRLGITLKNESGLYGDIAGYFRQCRYFFLLDIENSKIKHSRIVENTSAQNGMRRFAADELLKYRVTHVIAGEMSASAQQKLANAGVKVFDYSGNVKEAMEDFLATKTGNENSRKEYDIYRS